MCPSPDLVFIIKDHKVTCVFFSTLVIFILESTRKHAYSNILKNFVKTFHWTVLFIRYKGYIVIALLQ